MLNVSEQNLGQIAVLRCSGRLVLGNEITLLQRAVISQSSKRIVVLDLAGIDAIDGSGVGLLVFLHAWTRANHIEMRLMDPAKRVQEILELTNLQSVLATWSCEDLASLLSGAARPAHVDEKRPGGRAGQRSELHDNIA